MEEISEIDSDVEDGVNVSEIEFDVEEGVIVSDIESDVEEGVNVSEMIVVDVCVESLTTQIKFTASPIPHV